MVGGKQYPNLAAEGMGATESEPSCDDAVPRASKGTGACGH